MMIPCQAGGPGNTLWGRGVWWACASRVPAQRWCPETLSLCPCCPNLRYPSPVWHWWPWFSQPKFTAHCFTLRAPHRTFLSVHARDKEGKPSSWLPVPSSISVSYRSQLHTPIGFHQSLQPSALMCIACSFIFGMCCCFYHQPAPTFTPGWLLQLAKPLHPCKMKAQVQVLISLRIL